ncbi:MAG: DUF2141 domain-containing protein [Cyanobacteria bacterium P01_A01_bin.3]
MLYLSLPFVWLAIAGSTAIPDEFPTQPKNQLTVTVNGFRTQEGQICLSLFDSEAGFPTGGERAVATQCVELEETTPAITFDLPVAGDYAVAVFHDANGDGTLNVNMLGIPREGFGFSRNPRISMRPPKFEDAAVAVNGESNIEIRLKYIFGS